MNRNKRIFFYIIDIIIMIIMITADRITKMWAVSALKDKDAIELIPHVLEFHYLENRGAAFGMLQDMKYFFIVVGIIFLVVIFIALYRIPVKPKYRILRFCLCMVSAGAFGNLYDRITQNYVIDFIYFVYINFPIFNVADCFVTISTAILLILFIFVYREDDLNMKKANTVKIHSSMLEPEKSDNESDPESDNGKENAGNK